MLLILLVVLFISGVIDFDDQLVFCCILPERLVHLLVNKLEGIQIEQDKLCNNKL